MPGVRRGAAALSPQAPACAGEVPRARGGRAGAMRACRCAAPTPMRRRSTHKRARAAQRLAPGRTPLGARRADVAVLA
eukprot:CAMPEP_0176228374 /NCGR_PEP_ID=MMETSP0121_2-20121125/23244_1 /TAXON_ID=160619 /ORGANISM="Kryptoperidinium foliaceum, Strain CCMP 1326" /LENGTH=77 /DNA_ID=CAMNT_0017567671 /DNA_START=38 /DNA_END=267 /DNA_ORIENTATION=+